MNRDKFTLVACEVEPDQKDSGYRPFCFQYISTREYRQYLSEHGIQEPARQEKQSA